MTHPREMAEETIETMIGGGQAVASANTATTMKDPTHAYPI